MAVSELDSGVMEARAPPTPPSDQMDVDSNTHGGPLQNGHIAKTAPLSTTAPVLSSTQVSTQNVESVLLNGVKISYDMLESSQSSKELRQPSPVNNAGDVEKIPSSTDQAELNTSTQISEDRSSTIEIVNQANATTSIPPPPVQPLTSDLREDIQPVSPERTAEIKEQRQQQDLDHDPELANGLEAGGPDPIARVMDPLPEPTPGADAPARAEDNATASPVRTPPVRTPPVKTPPAKAPLAKTPPVTSLPADEDTTDATATKEDTLAIATTDLPHHPPVPIPEGAEVEQPIDPAPSPVKASESARSELPVHPAPSPAKATESTPSALPMDATPSQPPQAVAPAATDAQDPSSDHEMQDAPVVQPKVAREREEDDEVDYGPASKRPKTDDESSSVPEFKVPELPELNTNVGDARAENSKTEAEQPMTKPQHKFLLKVIQNIKRTNDAAPFNKPVDIVALNIPNYPTIITKPMDLRTMEEKLKNNSYPSVNAYESDFNQIVENCITFNGLDHVVTKNAQNIKASFDKQMQNLPGPEVVEPPPADKKKKAPAPTAAKAAPSRRESRSSLPGSARSPITAASPTTFALGPQGVPLIRRDSTVGDGRPKREIHPPAPRDLPYANQKPKKKKYQMELKFCQHVMNELSKPKYQHVAFPFQSPVDPVALNIPHYHKLIKNPMDLGTVGSKLSHGQYENAKEFEADVRLIFQNCYKFNPPTDPVHGMGKQLEAIFDDKWAEKARWIEANTPSSGPQSPGSTPEPDEEEEEEEEDEEEEEEEQSQLSKLQQQIAAMSRQVELITQKKKTPPVPAKKGKGGKQANKKESKKGASAAPAKAEKKAPKPAKKEKTPYVTYEQKQDISNRINSLSETRMATALKIIRDNMPSLKGVQEDEIELDIDELSDDVLHKLLVFVRKHAPRPDDSPPRRAGPASQNVAVPRKKNKPMSKTEQEARIEQVRGNLHAFQNPGSDEAPDPFPAAQANDTSGDDDDSEESEEE
ncbi:hypothetical protein MMC22_011902 [Lobaria immixta]|nr:hypothetical protein [Lobaria immixta]